MDNIQQQQQPSYNYQQLLSQNNTATSNYLRPGVNDHMIRDMIDQNQRHIKEVNKDALNQFKKMITSELGSDNGTIQTVDDEDDIDSMDTDSLLSARSVFFFEKLLHMHS